MNWENEINRLKDKIQDMIDLGHEHNINAEKKRKLCDLEIINKEGNPIDRYMN